MGKNVPTGKLLQGLNEILSSVLNGDTLYVQKLREPTKGWRATRYLWRIPTPKKLTRSDRSLILLLTAAVERVTKPLFVQNLLAIILAADVEGTTDIESLKKSVEMMKNEEGKNVSPPETVEA